MKRKVSETLKKQVAARQGWCCAPPRDDGMGGCGTMLSAFFEVDHVVALCYGGTNDDPNLQALCRECHAKKGAVERRSHETWTAARADTDEDAFVSSRRSNEMFNQLFEPWAGGAFPLAVAKRMCVLRFGTSFDERHIAVYTPHMCFPPHFATMFTSVGMVPQPAGPMLQSVRPRRGPAHVSTRSTR